MNVLFFPYFPNNPYQPNLAEALAEFGCRVEGVKNVSLLSLLRAVRGKDVFHLHWTHPYVVSDRIWKTLIKCSIFFPILTYVKLRGRTLVWTVHNLGEHEKKQRRLEIFAHRLLTRLCDGIIVHSRYAAEKVREIYRVKSGSRKVRIIPHGNYIGNYPQEMSREEARQMFDLSDDRKVFLFLGQIRKYKGVPELVSAFLRASTGDELLLLAGFPFDPETHEEVARQAEKSENVRYHPGFISEEKIQAYMKAADVVVFPFRSIFTSGSILLAMSFGKAIVVPALDSLEEVIEAGGAVTFAPEEAGGLEAALKEALTADLEKLGSRNLEAARELSWSSIAEKTFGIYVGS